jgi:hypothetical protein
VTTGPRVHDRGLAPLDETPCRMRAACRNRTDDLLITSASGASPGTATGHRARPFPQVRCDTERHLAPTVTRYRRIRRDRLVPSSDPRVSPSEASPTLLPSAQRRRGRGQPPGGAGSDRDGLQAMLVPPGARRLGAAEELRQAARVVVLRARRPRPFWQAAAGPARRLRDRRRCPGRTADLSDGDGPGSAGARPATTDRRVLPAGVHWSVSPSYSSGSAPGGTARPRAVAATSSSATSGVK